MKTQTIYKALKIILLNTGREAYWIKKEQRDLDGKMLIDGKLELQIGKEKIQFFAEIKNEVKNYQLDQILRLADQYHPMMLIAKRIFPKIREALRKHEIAYLEENGNFFLKNGDTHIWIDGNKPLNPDKEKMNRAFTKTGLRVIFEFLLDNALINEPYREIARKTKVGLGNINYIMQGLKEEGFLVLIDKGTYRLINKKQLLEKWIALYPQKLKPTLQIGKFRFLKIDDFTNWKQVNLHPMKTWWGGEPAGNILTDYLKPATLTLYTLEAREELILHYRLMPDDNGLVEIYERFWVTDQVNDNLAPPLLVYADLLNTGDARCMETAQKIYDDYLANKF